MTRQKLLQLTAYATLLIATSVGPSCAQQPVAQQAPPKSTPAPVQPPPSETPTPSNGDAEAFRPNPGAEATSPRTDAEVVRQRSESEASRARPDPEAFRPQTDFEAEKPRAVDTEAFTPRANFEAARTADPLREAELRAPVAAQEPPPTRQLPDEAGRLGLLFGKAPLERRVVVQGDAREIEPNRWVVAQAKGQEPLTFQSLVSPRTTAALLRGPAVRATAISRLHPTGMLEGIAITRDRELLYLAEVVKDEAPLVAADRSGFTVTQITTNLGRSVAEGDCHKTYEVPVTVARAGQSVQLQAGETETLGEYRVNVIRSRYAVEQPCRYSFEEPTTDLEYVIWKASAGQH